MEEEKLESWHREILANHRWGRHGGQVAAAELAHLLPLRAAAGDLGADRAAVLDDILLPEICNWNLVGLVLAVCDEIGAESPGKGLGAHKASVTPQRWRRIWAYYLACCRWLSERPVVGRAFGALLEDCDPECETQRRVESLLGEPDEIKRLCVERFRVCLEAWLDGLPGEKTPRGAALRAAAAVLEERILRLEPEPRVPFHMIRLDDHSILQPCHHKLFRRYDIILSSIGDGQWRHSMPLRGTDGERRGDEIDPYIAALEKWVCCESSAPVGEPAVDIYRRLSGRTAFKKFAAALLASLMRSQQLSARLRARNRKC